MKAIEQVRRARVDSESWVPCVTSDGRTIGDAQWMKRRVDDQWSHTAMLWRCKPMTFDYVFPGDESFIVFSGRVRIDLENGSEPIELRQGDAASFPKGVRSVWTVLETIEKFTVVSG